MNTTQLSRDTNRRAGFSWIELVVVILALAVIAVVLIPRAKKPLPEDVRAVGCQEHLHQLAVGWGAYAVDHQEELMPNPGWMSGRMGWREGEGRPVYFDEQRLLSTNRGVMANYVHDAKAYHCPADTFKLPGYPTNRVRSYSMNGVLVGKSPSGASVRGTSPDGRKYLGRDEANDTHPARKMSDLEKPGPAGVFVLLDEHPDSIEDATFMFDPGYEPGTERWRDLPGANHDGGAGLVFADGHAEIHKWVELYGTNKTVYPVTMAGGSPWETHALGTSKDYEWLQDHMPYQ